MSLNVPPPTLKVPSTSGRSKQQISPQQGSSFRGLSRIRQSDFILHPALALRASAVIEDTIKKLELLDILSGDIKELIGNEEENEKDQENEDTTNDQERNAVANILEEQRVLGNRYESLSYILRSQKDQNSMKQSLEEINKIKQEQETIQKKLKDNTKKLCRNLKETPNELENWKKIQTERDEIKTIFKRCLEDIQTGLKPQIQKTNTPKFKNLNSSNFLSGMFDVSLSGNSFDTNNLNVGGGGDLFLSSESASVSSVAAIRLDVPYDNFMKIVKEEKERKEYLQYITEQEGKTLEQVIKLRNEVIREKESKKKDVEDKSTKINNLLNKLRKLKKMTEEEDAKHHATEEASFQSRRRRENSVLLRLEEESIKKTIEVDVEKNVFSEVDVFLEKKTKELKEKGDFWKDKLEKESEELRSKISHWESMREDQIEKLKQLEERYEKEKDFKRLSEEQDALAKKKEAEDLERKIHNSANIIKLAFKCYKAREEFASRKKKKPSPSTKQKTKN
ncbi:hypothetical protein ABK040_005604 [Willaertia magna]